MNDTCLTLPRSVLFAFGMVSVVATVSGCCHLPYVWAANAAVESSAEETNAEGASMDVVATAKRLATVKRVAVVPFRDLSFRRDEPWEVFPGHWLSGKLTFNHDAAGELFSEHFEEVLLTSSAVEVVERSRLKAVFDEKALQATGLVGDALPEVVAGNAGADAVLVGTITQGTFYRPDRPEVIGTLMFGVSVRLIDTRDGRILAAGRDFMVQTGRIPEPQALMRAMATRLLAPLIEKVDAAKKANPDIEMPERESYMEKAPAADAPTVDDDDASDEPVSDAGPTEQVGAVVPKAVAPATPKSAGSP